MANLTDSSENIAISEKLSSNAERLESLNRQLAGAEAELKRITHSNGASLGKGRLRLSFTSLGKALLAGPQEVTVAAISVGHTREPYPGKDYAHEAHTAGALLAIYAFALVVSYGKWRWALKGAGWTNGEKRIAVVLVTAIFLGLAALDAFYNHKLGFRQYGSG